VRRRARKDENQNPIVGALAQANVQAIDTSQLGKGFPDLVIGFRGKNYLIEVKNPAKPLSDRQLTDDQKKFHSAWHGQVNTVETIDEILAIIGATK